MGAVTVGAIASAGVDVNRLCEDETAAHVAAREGHLGALEALLAHGLDANATSRLGGTPLIEAATYGHANCVRRLLAVPGIDLFVTEDEKTALDWAKDPSEHAEVTEGHR